MPAGRKGQVSQDTYKHRYRKIRAGKASLYSPRYSLEEAIRRAGL